MILRGDKVQWDAGTITATTEDSIYLHPGNPDADGATMGEAAHNHIVLKDFEFWGNNNSFVLRAVRLHYLGGGQEDLLNYEANGVLGYSRSGAQSWLQDLRTEINLLTAIEFVIYNGNEVGSNYMVKIRYEMVK